MGDLQVWLLRLQRRPWLVDLAVLVMITGASVHNLVSGSHGGPFGEVSSRDLPRWALIALSAGMILPLWWRRRAPMATFAAVAVVSLLQFALGVWLQAGMSVLIAIYSVAVYGSLRGLAWAFAVTAAQLTLAVLLLVPFERTLVGLFLLLGTTTAASSIGLMVRTRAAYLAALEDRAARLEVERDQRVQLTAATERSRVAREMHDIVGHNLSVMIGLADGAALLASNRGEKSAEPLRLIGETGRQALGELRRVLGVLRDGGEEDGLTPQPDLAELDDLVARVRAAGLPVDYRTSGAVHELKSGIQLAVYRIVQEALTNIIKHAGTTTAATVLINVTAGQVRIQVLNTAGEHPPPAPGEPGHGLVGIRERAGLYGGEVVTGRRDDGGWAVDVRMEAR
ncbi:sensor histidine kinase [Actinoplanes sp. TFC3]|uniref:sensor histidine kinase n=1 Tax=Actinoplanes sp. TFC3 TaxID=1710355 RepID=UPI001EFFAFD9|nr:histidine kinase [Actinoplanes sp. TFC3]